MEGLSPVHLIAVLVVAVLVLGPGRLPQTGAALGHALRSFREGLHGDETPDPGAATPSAASDVERRP